MRKSFFITFDGLDASGKTTQINFLNRLLALNRIDCVLTKEPAGSSSGSEIFEIIKKYHNNLDNYAELFLMSAARAQNVKSAITPYINERKVIVSDRYYDSTTAYQGYALGLDLFFVDLCNSKAIKDIEPDVTFFIDISIDEAKRRNKSEYTYDSDYEFQEKCRKGYIDLLRRFPDRIVKIDGNQPKDYVFRDIIQELLPRLSNRGFELEITDIYKEEEEVYE